jgi:deoxycytidylate deaminase
MGFGFSQSITSAFGIDMGKRQTQSVTAIIFDKKGRVLSVGKNSYVKTHPKQAEHARKVGLPEKVYLHAEMEAIIRCRDLSRADRILVTRVLKSGKYGNAKPCPVCQSAIKEAGIPNIEWSES